jgi:hypothetical protein
MDTKPDESLPSVEHDGWLDAVIRRIGKFAKVAAFITAFLGVGVAFFLRTNDLLLALLVVVFLVGIDTFAVGALLVAYRELRLVKTKSGGKIGVILFWGSFGILVLISTVIMVASIFRR